MRRHLYYMFVGAMFMLFMCQQSAYAQPDDKTRDLVILAKNEYNTKNYLQAANAFELVTQKPQNEFTTFSWYMVGMSYYRGGDKEKALKAFEKFLSKYPRSDYHDEARYHRALCMLESEHTNDRERGLDELFKIISTSVDAKFVADVEQTTRHFLSEVLDIAFLDLYMVFVEAKYEPWVMEGICLQFDRKGEGYKLLEKLKTYQNRGGKMTPLLTSLKTKYESGKVTYTDRLNVAVFLSFNLQLADTARTLPGKSEKSVEMLEGMMLALDSMGATVNKRINIMAFDTRGDTTLIEGLLDSLVGFQPDVIIGDIKSGLATAISDWAEKNKVVHLIPRNPLNTLISNKKYTFLIHPSLQAHGAQMARYLVDVEGKHRFVVFNDRTFFAEKFASAFKSELADEAGITVTEKIIPARYGDLQSKLSAELKGMKGQEPDAIYVPLSNEESAGLIISKLNYDGIKTEVVGSPDWEVFTVIDQELKSSYKLKYSSFYYESNDSTGFDALNYLCLQEYAYRPSNYTVQGFDIMAWLLTVSKGLGPSQSLVDAIHKAAPYHGISQDFYFGPQQDNQKINILLYNNGRLDKVNRDQKEP